MNLAIIGGGITGLSTALEAVKRGANVSVFERNKIMIGTTEEEQDLNDNVQCSQEEIN